MTEEDIKGPGKALFIGKPLPCDELCGRRAEIPPVSRTSVQMRGWVGEGGREGIYNRKRMTF